MNDEYALTEKVALELCARDHGDMLEDGDYYRDAAAPILPLIRAAQAEALRKAADDVEPLSEYAAAVVRVRAAELERIAGTTL